MLKKRDENSIAIIILKTWIPVILSGVMLSWLNYYYWQKQELYKLNEVKIHEKINLYSDISKNITSLINHINQYHELKSDIGNKKSLKNNLSKKDDEIIEILMAISGEFSKSKIYFSKEAADKLQAFLLLMKNAGKEQITTESDIYKKAMEITSLLSSEIKKDFDN